MCYFEFEWNNVASNNAIIVWWSSKPIIVGIVTCWNVYLEFVSYNYKV
jgi:hypothetical protein